MKQQSDNAKAPGRTGVLQTSIPAPENQHDYRDGLDKTLQAQQLQDLIRNGQQIRLGKGRSANRGFDDTPLFGNSDQQTKLF